MSVVDVCLKNRADGHLNIAGFVMIAGVFLADADRRNTARIGLLHAGPRGHHVESDGLGLLCATGARRSGDDAFGGAGLDGGVQHYFGGGDRVFLARDVD